jgi:NADPH:quinone reductase-like Zn-dependent oxidoreductase
MGQSNWGDTDRASTITMRAARYYGKEDIRIEDVDEQKCGEGQVRVCVQFHQRCPRDG